MLVVLVYFENNVCIMSVYLSYNTIKETQDWFVKTTPRWR